MAGWKDVLKGTLKGFGEDGGTRLAAALSYYTVFSLPPLLVLLLLILGAVLDPSDVERLLQGEVGALLGPAASEQIATVMVEADRPSGRGLAAVLGVGALLFGAVGAFVELQNALNRVWDVKPDPETGGIRRFLSQRIMSFGMLLTIVFLLMVSLVVSSALSAFGDTFADMLPAGLSAVVLHAVNLGLSLAVITLLFALLLKYVPDAEIAWRDAWVGAAVTAVLFTVGQFALGMYLGRSNPGSAFGAAGALVLLLAWIYYSAIILFLGAEFTQSYATLRGSGIEPADGAVRVTERQP
ncbi:MAG TPA: YihY/virulence factor BrkB family protein [Longimicrobiales bacterium]|nr:YihY/virulence factor BrkB family protein [Longimicrobiales bacterium]